MNFCLQKSEGANGMLHKMTGIAFVIAFFFGRSERGAVVTSFFRHGINVENPPIFF